MYSDGGSRGNPGPAALGVYIETLDKAFGEFLGNKTNNEAEYAAIVAGLKKIKSLLGKEKAKKSRSRVSDGFRIGLPSAQSYLQN